MNELSALLSQYVAAQAEKSDIVHLFSDSGHAYKLQSISRRLLPAFERAPCGCNYAPHKAVLLTSSNGHGFLYSSEQIHLILNHGNSPEALDLCSAFQKV